MKVLFFIRQRSFAKYIMIDILNAIRDLGWEVKWKDLEEFVRLNKDLSEEKKHNAVAGLLSDIKKFNPDLIFSYGLEYFSSVFEELLPTLNLPFHKIYDKPAVCFFFDFGYPFDTSEMDDVIREFFSNLQRPNYRFFCWDKDALEIMREFGLTKSFYFPMAVNEKIFYKLDKPYSSYKNYKSNILFVGGATPERIAHLEGLADLGLKVYGYDNQQWEANHYLKGCYCGPIKEIGPLRECYNATKISVNITRPHGSSSLNMRVYEAMACGSLMLTDDKGDARELFMENEEIIIYTSEKDLRKKAEYFLKNKYKREEIAEAGRRRVLKEHTYFARLKKHLPLIIQYFKELAVFNKVETLAEEDPKTALALISQREIIDLVPNNMDNYYHQVARLNFILKDIPSAGIAIAQGLKVNPFHVEIQKLNENLNSAHPPDSLTK